MPERNKGSSRLHFSEEKAEAKVEKAAVRVEKIRTNIPKKKTLSVTRTADEATGKSKLRLHVFTNSGVRNVGRLGATSLYGACQKITPEEARPGDLIFFEKTISGVDGITHCGIYVGDGFMLHCGSVRPDRAKVEVDERGTN